jgi:hypothetical protein
MNPGCRRAHPGYARSDTTLAASAQHRRQSKAALAGTRGCIQQRPARRRRRKSRCRPRGRRRMLAFGRGVLLVEDLALAAAARRGAGAETIECVAA